MRLFGGFAFAMNRFTGPGNCHTINAIPPSNRRISQEKPDSQTERDDECSETTVSRQQEKWDQQNLACKTALTILSRNLHI